MKLCNKCGVNISAPVDRCPLCYSMLTHTEGPPEQLAYPDLTEQAVKYNLVLRILLCLSITAGVVCVTVDFLTKTGGWSLIAIANIIYMWIAIGTALRRHTRLGYNITVQALSLAGMLCLFDYWLGNLHWALNYAVPALFVTAMLSITIIIIVRRMDMGSFILYFFLIALMGFIPLILWALGLATVLWPSLVSALYSATSLVSILILADNATKIELKKRFHI